MNKIFDPLSILGKIQDVFFDETLGTIEGYEVSGGMFADVMSGVSFLPNMKTINVGRDVAFVPSDVVMLMELQKNEGGIRKIMRETSDRMKSGVQTVQNRVASGFGQARDDIGGAMPERARVQTRVNEGAQNVRSEFTDAWTRIKEKATHMRDKLAGDREEMQIKSALGRPVTRVILDREDNAILKTGDIVTHESVEKARHAHVLDILVSSVYKDQPDFSSEELKERGSKDSY